MKTQFWNTKSLSQLNYEEWEALCDGCGRCCLVKLEDEDTGEIYTTNVACQLLNLQNCRCNDYAHRSQKVAMCLHLSPQNQESLKWLPETCAYRLLNEGKPLHSWHPLLSGCSDSVHEAGMSVKGFAQSEEYIHENELFSHIIE